MMRNMTTTASYQTDKQQLKKIEDIGKDLDNLGKIIDKNLEIFREDIKTLQKDFSRIIAEYNKIVDKSRSLFQEAIEGLNEENPIVGLTKFVVKGSGAAINYGLAWWKKKKNIKMFVEQLESFKKERELAINTKLETLTDIYKNQIPFFKEKVIYSLEQLLSFIPQQEKLLFLAKEKTEEAIVLYLKSSFLKGGVLYLQTALMDAKEGKLFVGNISIWKQEILKAPNELIEICKEKNWIKHPIIKMIASESRFLRGMR